MKSIRLTPELCELDTLNEFVLNEIPIKNTHINLIVEEIFVNIVKYSKTDYIVVNLDYDDSILEIEFIDNGIKFNPLLKEDPNFADDIDNVQIGGLGIFLTKKMADGLDYQYVSGENHLQIIKKVE